MANLSIELWAVTKTDLSGVTHVSVSSSRDEAVSHFMQYVYLFMHAASEGSFVVVGDDYDAMLTGLHLVWTTGDLVLSVASMTRPTSIGANPGYTPFDTAERSFIDLADEMNAAIALATDRLDPAEVQRLQYSSAAMALERPLAAELLVPDDDVPHKKVSQAKAKRIWSAMKSVDQYVAGTAVVRG